MLLALGPLGGHCYTYEYVCVATGTVASWRKEYPMENILLAFFFVELGKWGTHPLYRLLPLPPIQDVHS
jgi:hypothetical protein